MTCSEARRIVFFGRVAAPRKGAMGRSLSLALTANRSAVPRLCSTLLLVPLLGGCAFDIVHVEQQPARFDAKVHAMPFELVADIVVAAGPGYTRTLRKGSRWMPVGSVAEGDVFRSRDQVLTVEASNIHEAWLVVRANRVVGYYLVAEKTFSPVSSPVDLPSRPIP